MIIFCIRIILNNTTLQELEYNKGKIILIERLFSIGVYGKSKEEFFDLLVKNNIDTFCDIRKRRAVRGSLYSFVNSKRLQDELAKRNIKYYYLLDLAPTDEIRKIQYKFDSEHKIKMREREVLSGEFKAAYKKQILKNFKPESFPKLFDESAKNVVLFCVEANPDACHRSLVLQKLKEHFEELPIIHL